MQKRKSNLQSALEWFPVNRKINTTMKCIIYDTIIYHIMAICAVPTEEFLATSFMRFSCSPVHIMEDMGLLRLIDYIVRYRIARIKNI